METAAFIDEVAQRLVAYLASKDTDVRVNPAASLSTMRKTLDVQLPLKGTASMLCLTTWTLSFRTASKPTVLSS